MHGKALPLFLGLQGGISGPWSSVETRTREEVKENRTIYRDGAIPKRKQRKKIS